MMNATAARKTSATLATLSASRSDLEHQKAELEKSIAGLKVGREEEISERALGRSRQKIFDRRIGEQIADLEYDLRMVNEALEVNSALKDDPETIANEKRYSEQRKALDDALENLIKRAVAVDAAMETLRGELASLDDAYRIARELRFALGIAPKMHSDDFDLEVLSARMFGALSTHGLGRIIPPEENRAHGATMAQMIEATALGLRKEAGIYSVPKPSPVESRAEEADHGE